MTPILPHGTPCRTTDQPIWEDIWQRSPGGFPSTGACSTGRKKRGGGEQTVPYEELENCIAKDADPAQWYNEGCLRQVLDRFLSDLSAEQRVIFVRRYFYSDELEAIALRTGKSVGAVKALLYRLRTTLRKYLSEVGL